METIFVKSEKDIIREIRVIRVIRVIREIRG